MASVILREELLCSICLTLYTDPVTLRCGHNYCRGCIDRVLDEQDWSGDYSCPECRQKFTQRPALMRNITLRNVTERFLSTQPHQEITGIHCTYCVDSPVPAVRSCLHCEASLCDNHMRVHSKGPEHVLTDPSTSLETRKCPVHKKVLEYYCPEDAACICVSCRLDGEHWGHRVEMLDEASENKKSRLKNVLQKLITKRKQTEETVRSLEKRKRKGQEKAAGEAKRVTALFLDNRRRVYDLEKKVLSDISRKEEQVSQSLSALIHHLEIKRDDLSRKMRDIEELCNMTDPLTILQDPDTSDLCDPEEEGGDEDTGGHDGGDEDTWGHDGGDDDTGRHYGGDEDTVGHGDVDVIIRMFHVGFSDIIIYVQTTHAHNLFSSSMKYGGDDVILKTRGVVVKVTRAKKVGMYGEGPADILLDVNTAGNNLFISDDLKTAIWTELTQNRPETAERFQCNQVMSRRGFTSGRHYWEVEIRGSWSWSVGMCYPSIDRKGRQSDIGDNNKSWCLYGGKLLYFKYCGVRHDSKEISVPLKFSSNRFRICLDYEAGQLSFYELSDSIRYLYTYTASFSKPLHVVLRVREGYITVLGGEAVRKQ